ncbi:lipopolysaccharide heptosyltransferase II [Thiolapillus sp.]|uniref:lipopolysaccharide heptosyltransferase II n=1 Tax=Thiolapillus sp. TaxID=2017437 RepID=UPI0025CE9A19|nr:lipopolysaccharide heptosyltransferase II [Thiolapillus sp.]
MGPSWVGDMVMAQSLFRALKAKAPDTAIDVLAPGWSLPLLERMPEVRAGLEMPLGHGRLELGRRWQLGRSLRGRYRQAILLPNSWKSAIVPWAARIPLRTGWLGEMRYGLLNDIRRLDKSFLTMTVQRFVALAEAPQLTEIPEILPPRLEVDPADVQAALTALGLEKPVNQPVLALCPGAEYGDAKRWPEAHYADLARRYVEKGWQVWLFGSDKDRAVCDNIAAGAGGGCENLAGRTSLAQAVDLLSLADAVVSNDSGLMHVAAALERPLVAVYGSSDPGFTPPLNARHEVLSLGLECSPCFERECPLGHLRCLQDISTDQVQASLEKVAGKSER